MKPTKYLIIIVILSLALITTVFVVVRTTTTYQRAAESNTAVVLENSYLFASPLQAKADNKEMIRITVFLLDGRGLGVANQTVTLNLPKNITVTNQQEITDQNGKTIFDLVSSTAQTANITAVTDSSRLPQSVKIIFY